MALPDVALFSPLLATDELLAATSATAWVQAMLDAEAALALAEADAGVIPAAAAEEIARACCADAFDAEDLGRRGRLGGNPVIPLVEDLSAKVDDDAAGWVHWGATSQDILDTAAMLVAGRALPVVIRHARGLADASAAVAERHRSTLMAARTLLQHALPTTLGLKAAGWVAAADAAGGRLAAAADRLAVQLGGAAGTLASLGDAGLRVLAGFADRLGLAEPVLPWHTDRTRVVEIAAAVAEAAGVAAKVSYDVALLMQTEVGEASEPAAPGRGGSSTMPQKRNPVGAAMVGAAARRVTAAASLLFAAAVQEHERAVGGWQAEWQAVSELMAFGGSALAGAEDTVAGLEVDARRMRVNLDLTGGLLVAERVALALGAALGRPEAKRLVGDAGRRASAAGTSFAEALLGDPRVARLLSAEEVASLLDPAGYLGSAGAFIDRALDAHRRSGAELTPAARAGRRSGGATGAAR